MAALISFGQHAASAVGNSNKSCILALHMPLDMMMRWDPLLVTWWKFFPTPVSFMKSGGFVNLRHLALGGANRFTGLVPNIDHWWLWTRQKEPDALEVTARPWWTFGMANRSLTLGTKGVAALALGGDSKANLTVRFFVLISCFCYLFS